jgi:hypothetical protein
LIHSLFTTLLKNVQVGDPNADHSYWGRPEDMTMPRPAQALSPSKPGSDLLGETAAAMAAASILFNSTDPGEQLVSLIILA